jgi:hypothetical protein
MIRRKARPVPKRDAVKALIVHVVLVHAKERGGIPSDELEAMALRLGVGYTTYFRARCELGITPRRKGRFPQGRWVIDEVPVSHGFESPPNRHRACAYCQVPQEQPPELLERALRQIESPEARRTRELLENWEYRCWLARNQGVGL